MTQNIIFYEHRYCKDYQGWSKDTKYLEEDPEQEKACKEADKYLGKSNVDRLEELLVTTNENKENAGSVDENKEDSVKKENNVSVENRNTDSGKKVSLN